MCCVLSHFSRVWLFVTPWTVAHQASLFMEFSRQEYWSGLPSPPPGDYPDPRVEPTSLTSTCIGRCILFHLGHLGSMCVCMCLCLCACVYAQSCPTLCDPADCSPPGSSIHGIFQARILELVVISSSRGSSWPRDWTHVSYISHIAGRFFTCWATGKIQC